MRQAVRINDIEKLMLLADDVVNALQMSYDFYEELGIPIFEKYNYLEDEKNSKWYRYRRQ